MPVDVMPLRQKIVFISIGLVILTVIIELVRRRKLREEYTFLWLLIGVIALILPLWYNLLVELTYAIGAALPTSTLFFFGLLFVLLVNLHFSLKISSLTNQIKNLAQKIALLENKSSSDKQRMRGAG